MKQLISNLPQDGRQTQHIVEDPIAADTVCAVLACLNEVLLANQDFAK